MKIQKTSALIFMLCFSGSLLAQHNFFMNTGYSRRLSDSPNELFVNQKSDKDHRNTLKNGLNLNFAYDYTLKSYLAVGFRTNMFGSFDSYTDNQTSPNTPLTCSDDEYVFYIGPCARYIFKPIADKWTMSLRGTLGLMLLQNSQTSPSYNTTSKAYTTATTTYSGNCFSWGIDAMADYSINSWLSLNGSLGFMSGSIGKLKAVDQSFKLNNGNENLSRIDLAIGVSIKL